MKPITAMDITIYKMLSGLTFSPDGEKVALVAASAALKENNYSRYIYTADSKTLRFKKLTNGGSEGSFLWLDSKTLLFQRVTKKADQDAIAAGEELSVFCTISTDGGEAEELFRVPIKATGVKVIDDSKLLIYARHDLTYPDLKGLNADKKAAALKAYKAEHDVVVADELPFWFNGMGHTNKQRQRLYIYHLKTRHLEPITTPTFNVGSAVVCPCGSIVYTGTDFDKMNSKPLNGIYVHNASTGKTETLVASGKYGIGAIDLLGDSVVFSASLAKDDFDFVSSDLYTVSLKGKKIAKLLEVTDDLGCTTGSDCRLGGGSSFKVVEDTLYFVSSKDNMSDIVALKDGKLTRITKEPVCFESFDIQKGKCVAIGMSDVTLQEVYKVDLASGEYRKATSFNTKALSDKYVANCNPLSFTNKDGVRIDGWVLLPMDYDPKKKYPGVLEIHGGPRANYGPVFMHEMQVMASDGCFVFFCNPRGGSSRGDAFANITGKYGTIDYDDLMAFTDEVLKKYPAINPKKLGVTGGSYGGFMTNWIIGHTDRFAAAASQRSIANWGAFNMISDIGPFFGKREQQSDLWKDDKKMWFHSPLQYAMNAKTPTLFIHSFEDYRCWHPEAEQMYRALLDKKVPTRICFFKKENHELSRSGAPKHRIRRLKEITEWLYTYIKA